MTLQATHCTPAWLRDCHSHGPEAPAALRPASGGWAAAAGQAQGRGRGWGRPGPHWHHAAGTGKRDPEAEAWSWGLGVEEASARRRGGARLSFLQLCPPGGDSGPAAGRARSSVRIGGGGPEPARTSRSSALGGRGHRPGQSGGAAGARRPGPLPPPPPPPRLRLRLRLAVRPRPQRGPAGAPGRGRCGRGAGGRRGQQPGALPGSLSLQALLRRRATEGPARLASGPRVAPVVPPCASASRAPGRRLSLEPRALCGVQGRGPGSGGAEQIPRAWGAALAGPTARGAGTCLAGLTTQ